MLRSINVKVFAALILSALFVPFAIKAQSLDEILKSHFKAIGNEKLEKIETATSTGSITIASLGVDAPMSMYFKKPNKYRNELNIMGNDMVSVFNGSIGYVQAPGQPVTQMTPEEAKVNSQNNGVRDLLSEAKKNKDKISLVGKTKLDSSEAFKLKIIDHETGDSNFVYIDPNTWYMVKMETIKTYQGTPARIDINFSDFRTVDGITMPFKIATTAAGQDVTIKWDKVVFDTPIDDKQFEKPQ